MAPPTGRGQTEPAAQLFLTQNDRGPCTPPPACPAVPPPVTQRAPRRPSACDTTRPRLPPHAPRHSHPTSAALGSSVALSHTLLLAHLRGLTPPTDVAPDLSKYCYNQRDVCCHVASSSQSLETPEEQKRRVWGPLAGQLARADHIFLKPTLVPPGQLQLGPLLQDGGAKQAASPVNLTPQSLCASELCSQTGHCLAQRQARAAATAGQAANQQGRRRLVPTLTAKHWPGLLSETHTRLPFSSFVYSRLRFT